MPRAKAREKKRFNSQEWIFPMLVVIYLILLIILILILASIQLSLPITTFARGGVKLCSDSDGGRDYFTLGIVTVGSTTYEDFCQDKLILQEYYCRRGNVAYELVSCSDSCQSGACQQAPAPAPANVTNVTQNQTQQNYTQTLEIKGMRFGASYYYNQGYTAKTLASKIVTDAKNNNITTIFFHTYNSVYGAFYLTSYSYTIVEGGFGKQNMLRELINAAHANGIKVIASIPVNDFKQAWVAQPNWRSKLRNGSDYVPKTDHYFLSTWHDSYINWYDGFVKNLINNYPDLDGVEALEGIVDWNWNLDADYNSQHNQKYYARYPSGVLGDANWKLFRAEGLTNLHKILINNTHTKGIKAYVVQTWAPKDNGSLMTSEEIRDGSGFDFNGIMDLANKPDYLQAELIWQQWAYRKNDKATFNPDWTAKARDQFLIKVGGRTKVIVHVEITPFGSYAPTNSEFETSLRHARTGTSGADFYNHKQAQDKNAWSNVKAAYS